MDKIAALTMEPGGTLRDRANGCACKGQLPCDQWQVQAQAERHTAPPFNVHMSHLSAFFHFLEVIRSSFYWWTGLVEGGCKAVYIPEEGDVVRCCRLLHGWTPRPDWAYQLRSPVPAGRNAYVTSCIRPSAWVDTSAVPAGRGRLARCF